MLLFRTYRPISNQLYRKSLLPSINIIKNGSKLTIGIRQICSTTTKYDHVKPFVSKPYSYAFGRSEDNLVYKTAANLLEERSASETGRPMLISHHEGIKRTFSEINDDVNRIAKAMHEDLGLKHGDVVGLWSCNTYNWICIQYACSKLGVVLCTINPYYQIKELDYVLRKADIKALFMPGKDSEQRVVNNFAKIIGQTLKDDDVNRGDQEEIILKHIISIDGSPYEQSDLPSKQPIQSHTLDKLKQRTGLLDKSITELITPDDPAIIMFTSGTTGKPKGAYLSHFTIVNDAILTSKSMGSANDMMSCCVPLPFFHSFAGVLGNITMAALPNQVVIPCMKYDVAQVVDSMKVNDVTHILATPTLAIDLLDYIKKNNVQLPKLKSLLAGGASVPIETAQQFVKTVPSCVDFRIGYGATETGPCATTCQMHHTFEQRTETVGTPLDFVEVKIVDPETNSVVPLGQCGEILTRGFHVMLGYWKDPVKTKEVLDSAGWYNTGDLGTMDEDGFLKIVGRTKEMIIVGGENVYPRELEEILHTHPAISDVHVIGIPDPRKGEEVCAWVRLHDPSKPNVTEDELKKFCSEQMAYFKVPKHFLFVDSFPITTTGKAQKFIMREITCKKLNLKENS
ncbi:Acyl-CoA synthetase member 2 mitochondrial [Blomia tropicalis]|nr:Acyl-CoA synthetase member 2 mitochondrial [Blomia tropicalis]